MVTDIVRETLRKDDGVLSMTEEILTAIVDLRAFLWERVYEN
jgi:hypothetical protein